MPTVAVVDSFVGDNVPPRAGGRGCCCCGRGHGLEKVAARASSGPSGAMQAAADGNGGWHGAGEGLGAEDGGSLRAQVMREAWTSLKSVSPVRCLWLTW